MVYLTPENFSAYLLRFEEDYVYFASTYSGIHTDLLLDKFIKDHVNLAKYVLGFQYAQKVHELAIELSKCSYQIPGYSRRAFISPQLKRSQLWSN